MMNDYRPQKISLSKTIAAPAEKVFDHWLIPTFVGNWMFDTASGEDKIIELENEVRPHGNFSFKVSNQGNEVEYSGEYAEIRRPDRLAFSWISSKEPELESKVVVQFQNENDKTRVKFSQQLPADSHEDPEQTKDLWSRRLNALSERLNNSLG